jgi:hypothetical protein
MAEGSVEKLGTAAFPQGSINLYVPTGNTFKMGSEISGKVEVVLETADFIRGVWIKLMGFSHVKADGLHKVVDLLEGDVEHHKDGMHEVFVGFGEGDFDDGNLLELAAGTHSLLFHTSIIVLYLSPKLTVLLCSALLYHSVPCSARSIVHSSINRILLHCPI